MPRSRFPDALTLLTGCILIAAVLTYVLPAGQYDRVDDEATGRSVVVAGSFHPVEPDPVGPFEALVAIPRGLVDAAEIVFLVLLIGGAFTVVDQTGALRTGVEWLVDRLGHRETVVIPVVALFFATGGALQNMQEEIIALVPVLLILTRRVGFTPIVAVAVSAGAAFVGSAFSPINPFQVGIAQKVAELPLLSGGFFRLVSLAVALFFWIWTTTRYAQANRVTPEEVEADDEHAAHGRHWLILGIVVATFGFVVWGLLGLGWGFNELSALFFAMAVIVGLLGGLKVDGTAKAYALGFRDMAYAAVLIGFARGIFVVLQDGRIIDTIVQAMFAPVESLPVQVSALFMMATQAVIHVFVPSVSGQAVLTMPVLVPLSDLLGLSRQVTVLAYQFGAGLCDMITPTNGALMAIIAYAKVGYEEWLGFCLPRYLALMALGAVTIGVAIAIGLQ
jgi:uncharacterized ion transporter superfamily protein YfcC